MLLTLINKAFPISRKPSEVAYNAELLYQAMIEEFSVYQTDILTVGLDVYNIEAEAIGCKKVVEQNSMLEEIGKKQVGRQMRGKESF